jgi:hypothetical protein
MKEASWKECIENNSVVKVSIDEERARSLIETSEERVKLIKAITEKNCNFVFEDYYTSLLELLQALVIVRGYKILNHVCLGYYLRDILEKEDLFRIFDDLRYKRNSLTYYGKRMEFETAKKAIERCLYLIKEIKIEFENID